MIMAGYTKGAVYSHFSNKEELYLALLDAHLSAEGPEELEKMRDWGRLTYEFILHAMRDEKVRLRLADRFVRARNDYATSLEKRYAASGEIPPMDIEKLATALLAFENGLSLIGFVSPELISGGVYSATLGQLLNA